MSDAKCTCPEGYFWREKVHSPDCEQRKANQEKSNDALMANFNRGAAHTDEFLGALSVRTHELNRAGHSWEESERLALAEAR